MALLDGVVLDPAELNGIQGFLVIAKARPKFFYGFVWELTTEEDRTVWVAEHPECLPGFGRGVRGFATKEWAAAFCKAEPGWFGKFDSEPAPAAHAAPQPAAEEMPASRR
ncbi:hypothetical protein ABZ543_13345 [Streptomyces roseifaciens]